MTKQINIPLADSSCGDIDEESGGDDSRKIFKLSTIFVIECLAYQILFYLWISFHYEEIDRDDIQMIHYVSKYKINSRISQHRRFVLPDQ